MSPETVTLDEALRLLTLPRTLGESDGEEVVAANGRYGPYVKKGKESRSLDARGAALHDHARRGARQARRAAAARPPGRRAAAQGARRRPGQRQAGRRSRRAASAPTSRTARRTPSLRAGDTVETITPERAVRAAPGAPRARPCEEAHERGRSRNGLATRLSNISDRETVHNQEARRRNGRAVGARSKGRYPGTPLQEGLRLPRRRNERTSITT